MDRLTTTWRLVIEDAVTPTYGLAADEVCARRVGADSSPPTLRLYTYRPCALVGRFQTLDNELRLAHCEAEGIPVNRRPTGGGAIVMGPDQLGVAWTTRGADRDGYRHARALMVRFSEGLVDGLAMLGVDARFRGKNDLEVDGRKLAGLGVYRDGSGGVLYHASVLVGLDVRWMLRLLDTPFEKITDKTVETVAGRVTTVRRLVGREVSVDEVRQALARGFESAFDVTLAPSGYNGDELSEIAAVEQSKYTDPGWVRREVALPDTFGTHKVKTPTGLLEVRATLAGQTLKAVYIAGDFFAAEGALADLEGALRWHPADAAAIAATLDDVCARWGAGLTAIPRQTVLEAILTAGSVSGADGQYGCFVNPEGTQGTPHVG